MCTLFGACAPLLQVTFQYAIWDRLKMLASLSQPSVNNLWRLISHLVAHKALSLGVLRVWCTIVCGARARVWCVCVCVCMCVCVVCVLCVCVCYVCVLFVYECVLCLCVCVCVCVYMYSM